MCWTERATRFARRASGIARARTNADDDSFPLQFESTCGDACRAARLQRQLEAMRPSRAAVIAGRQMSRPAGAFGVDLMSPGGPYRNARTMRRMKNEPGVTAAKATGRDMLSE